MKVFKYGYAPLAQPWTSRPLIPQGYIILLCFEGSLKEPFMELLTTTSKVYGSRPSTVIYTFFSNTYETFTKIENMLGYKLSFNQFQTFEII